MHRSVPFKRRPSRPPLPLLSLFLLTSCDFRDRRSCKKRSIPPPASPVSPRPPPEATPNLPLWPTPLPPPPSSRDVVPPLPQPCLDDFVNCDFLDYTAFLFPSPDPALFGEDASQHVASADVPLNASHLEQSWDSITTTDPLSHADDDILAHLYTSTFSSTSTPGASASGTQATTIPIASTSTSPPSSSSSSSRKRGAAALSDSSLTPPRIDSPQDSDQVVKRQKNTEAARRYRQRKVDRLTELEDALAEMKKERDELKMQLARSQAETDVWRRMAGK